MLKEFKFSFEELQIDPVEIEELMGFEPGECPEPFPELIKTGLVKAPDHCDIRGGYKIFGSVIIDVKNTAIQIENQKFEPDKIVVSQIKKASQAALFVCTAGSGISAFSKDISSQGNLLPGYVLDTIGSVVVEKAMDKIQEKLKTDMENLGLSISDRFSPGYCEWNVAEQQKLFALLPPNFCGVLLSMSSLMDPIKSISGIIGIGKGLKQLGYQCNWCNDTQCSYGKIKRKKKESKKS